MKNSYRIMTTVLVLVISIIIIIIVCPYTQIKLNNSIINVSDKHKNILVYQKQVYFYNLNVFSNFKSITISDIDDTISLQKSLVKLNVFRSKLAADLKKLREHQAQLDDDCSQIESSNRILSIIYININKNYIDHLHKFYIQYSMYEDQTEHMNDDVSDMIYNIELRLNRIQFLNHKLQ